MQHVATTCNYWFMFKCDWQVTHSNQDSKLVQLHTVTSLSRIITCYNTADMLCCFCPSEVRIQSDSLSASDWAPRQNLQWHMFHALEGILISRPPFLPFSRRHNWSYRMWPWLNTRSHFRINHALHELGINHGRNRCSVSIPQSDCNGIFISSTINNISPSFCPSGCSTRCDFPPCYFKMFLSNDGVVVLWDSMGFISTGATGEGPVGVKEV